MEAHTASGYALRASTTYSVTAKGYDITEPSTECFRDCHTKHQRRSPKNALSQYCATFDISDTILGYPICNIVNYKQNIRCLSYSHMYRSYVRHMLCHVRTLFSNLALVHMVPKWKRTILLIIWVYHVSDCEYFNRSTSAWVGQVNTIILRILLSDKFQDYRDPKTEACFSVHWQISNFAQLWVCTPIPNITKKLEGLNKNHVVCGWTDKHVNDNCTFVGDRPIKTSIYIGDSSASHVWLLESKQ
jgi:hypothetical protein